MRSRSRPGTGDRSDGAQPATQSLRRLAQQSLRLFPADARVGDRDAVPQRRRLRTEILASFDEIALEHRADQGAIAGGALLDDARPHDALALVRLAGVRVAAVD